MCVFTWAARCCAIKGASYGNTAGIKSALGTMMLTQDGHKAKFLWLMNDIVCVDSDWGLLDPVDVEIKVVISLD